MPWLLNEDGALKLKLQGLFVYDPNSGPNGRRVPVRFRLPEDEVADLTFPIIVIEHAGWLPAPERMHDGYVTIGYAPEGLPVWFDDTGPATTSFDPTTSPYRGFFPIAYNLDYTISVYTRMMQEHMMPLVAQLAQYDRLHPKYGFLDVPQDGTKRTLQLLGGGEPGADKDSDGKRIFRTQYKVRVFSELLPNISVPSPATLINLDLSVYSDVSDLTGESLTEEKSLLAVGGGSSWNVHSLDQ